MHPLLIPISERGDSTNGRNSKLLFTRQSHYINSLQRTCQQPARLLPVAVRPGIRKRARLARRNGFYVTISKLVHLRGLSELAADRERSEDLILLRRSNSFRVTWKFFHQLLCFRLKIGSTLWKSFFLLSSNLDESRGGGIDLGEVEGWVFVLIKFLWTRMSGSL